MLLQITKPNNAAEREMWEARLSECLARLESEPDHPVGNKLAGRLLANLGRFDEASGYFRRALAVEPRDVEGWYYLGMTASMVDESETLNESVRQLAALAPTDALNLTRSAVLLCRSGDHKGGLSLAERALSLDAEPRIHGWTRRVMAECYEVLGDQLSQLRQLESAVAIGPASARDVASIAYLENRLGRPITVLPHAEALVAKEPENPEAWYALGVCANRMGDWPRALTALERAQELGYDYQAGLGREMGAALGHVGRHREGIPYLEVALTGAETAESRAGVHSHLGFHYSRAKDRQLSLEHYQAAALEDPADADAQQGIGAAYADLKDFESAIPHLEAATGLDPENEHRWYALGRVLAWTGDYERAEEALLRSISLGRRDGQARAQLAYVYGRQGKPQAAAAEAKRALRQRLPRKWRAWVADLANKRH